MKIGFFTLSPFPATGSLSQKKKNSGDMTALQFIKTPKKKEEVFLEEIRMPVIQKRSTGAGIER